AKTFEEIRWPGDEANESAKSDMAVLVGDFADRFYSVWYDAVKLADPNHLVLGSRIPLLMDEVVLACARHTDVLSFNHYSVRIPADFEQYFKKFDTYVGKTDKPILIGEYAFDSLDAGLQAAYVPVKDQEQRGVGFTWYTEQAAAKPFIVGTHYFQFVDEPLTGRSDGESSFNGFVSVVDVPYRNLVEAARKTNSRIYDIHAGVLAPATLTPVQPLPQSPTRDE
ncbi:MAG: hypothetical protein K2Z81_07620, partial [Cyanobacteria bacterium]|nr:hypothetical protein [Cyanobacteriota bacterium]